MENLDLFPDFTKKLSILRALEYTSDMDVVQLKGRVACEVNTCDELVLTELVFENVLEGLPVPTHSTFGSSTLAQSSGAFR